MTFRNEATAQGAPTQAQLARAKRVLAFGQTRVAEQVAMMTANQVTVRLPSSVIYIQPTKENIYDIIKLYKLFDSAEYYLTEDFPRAWQEADKVRLHFKDCKYTLRRVVHEMAALIARFKSDNATFYHENIKKALGREHRIYIQEVGRCSELTPEITSRMLVNLIAELQKILPAAEYSADYSGLRRAHPKIIPAIVALTECTPDTLQPAHESSDRLQLTPVIEPDVVTYMTCESAVEHLRMLIPNLGKTLILCHTVLDAICDAFTDDLQSSTQSYEANRLRKTIQAYLNPSNETMSPYFKKAKSDDGIEKKISYRHYFLNASAHDASAAVKNEAHVLLLVRLQAYFDMLNKCNSSINISRHHVAWYMAKCSARLNSAIVKIEMTQSLHDHYAQTSKPAAVPSQT